MRLAYVYLTLTIFLDAFGIALLNKANGVANPRFLLLGLLLVNGALVALSLALRDMDVTIANATFAGASSILTALLGYAWFGERYTAFQYGCLALILFGLVGLNLTGGRK